MSRSPGPARISVASGSDADLARKALGEAERRAELSGNGVEVIRHTLADGRSVKAMVHGAQKLVRVDRPKDAKKERKIEQLDQLRLFVSSPDGLRIFDVDAKRLIKTVAGLHPYEVCAASAAGTTVWMVGNNVPVRVNLSNDTAFGFSYTINAVDLSDVIVPAQRASVKGLQLSPDQTRVLNAFDIAYDPGTAVAVDGLGGYILADSGTLAPLRPAIRMSFRPQVSCFGPDGKFYVSVTKDTDPGDAPHSDVTTSDKDYVARFSAEGVLEATRLIYTFPFAPDAGFNRTIQAMVVNEANTRLYVLGRQSWSSSFMNLQVFDLTDPTMPLIGTTTLGQVGRVMLLNRKGDRLAILCSGTKVAEFDVTVDIPVLLHETTSTKFGTLAAFGLDAWAAQMLLAAPPPKVSKFPDRRRWLFNNSGTTGVLYGYHGFEHEPVYAYDLSALLVSDRYALAIGGLHEVETSA